MLSSLTLINVSVSYSLSQSTINKQLLRNVTQALRLTSCDFCIVPTKYQSLGLPEIFHKTHVIYDIARSDVLKPHRERLSKKIPRRLKISYSAKCEPIRGFPEFINTLPIFFPNTPMLMFLLSVNPHITGTSLKSFNPIDWAQSQLQEYNINSNVIFHHRLSFADWKVISTSDIHFCCQDPSCRVGHA